jgi:hypothetical protein
MTSLTESPCAFAAGQWTFSAPPAPAVLPTGNYTITHASYPGTCLALDEKSNVVMSPTNCNQAIWYFSSATDAQGNLYYLINYISKGLQTVTARMLSLVTDSPTNCDGNTKLVYMNEKSPQGSTFRIELGTNSNGGGNTIFDADCEQFYVPTNTSINVAWDANDPKIAQWSIQNVVCPAPIPQPTGFYIFSFQDTNNVTQYLSYTLNDPSWGNFLSFTSTFSLNTCSWKYDNASKILSTGCASTVYYLTKSSNFSDAILTTDVSKARNDVVVSNNIIFLGTYQALVPSANLKRSVNVYSCLAPNATWTVTPLSTPPPPSLDSGNYIIKYAGKCLFVNDSNQVILDTCPGTPTVWTYNKNDQTLTSSGQCLTNNSGGCAALQNLVLGACGGANTKRFLLGTNGKIYDPVLGMCYNPAGATMQSTMPAACRTYRKVSSSSANIIFIILGILIGSIIIAFIVSKQWKKKPRLSNIDSKAYNL